VISAARKNHVNAAMTIFVFLDVGVLILYTHCSVNRWCERWECL